MRILVIGGGFIAQSFISFIARLKRALQVQVDIILYVRSTANLPTTILQQATKIHEGDAANITKIEAILFKEAIDFVLILAGCTTVSEAKADTYLAYHSNFDIIGAVCDACTGYTLIKGIIIASSSSVYSAAIPRNRPFTEDAIIDSKLFNSTYVRSKYCAEIRAQDFPSLPVVVLRLANLYGPLDRKSRLIPVTINRLLHQEAPVIYIDEDTGKAANLDFLYVDDCCNAIYRILEKIYADAINKNDFPSIINIGTGNVSSTEDIVLSLIKLIDPSIKPKYQKMKDVDYANPGMCVKLLNEKFNVSPATSLNDGLCMTFEAWKIDS